MKVPLPTNKLVAFSLAGGLVAVVASVALALPGALPVGASSQSELAPPEDAPFVPARAPDAPGREEWEDREEHERDEHRWGDDDFDD